MMIKQLTLTKLLIIDGNQLPLRYGLSKKDNHFTANDTFSLMGLGSLSTKSSCVFAHSYITHFLHLSNGMMQHLVIEVSATATGGRS